MDVLRILPGIPLFGLWLLLDIMHFDTIGGILWSGGVWDEGGA